MRHIRVRVFGHATGSQLVLAGGAQSSAALVAFNASATPLALNVLQLSLPSTGPSGVWGAVPLATDAASVYRWGQQAPGSLSGAALTWTPAGAPLSQVRRRLERDPLEASVHGRLCAGRRSMPSGLLALLTAVARGCCPCCLGLFGSGLGAGDLLDDLANRC
jgi:hypothetical protein